MSYGVLQDGPGEYVVNSAGTHITLYGNTWKAFPIQDYEISSRTVLEFDFIVNELAEGHGRRFEMVNIVSR